MHLKPEHRTALEGWRQALVEAQAGYRRSSGEHRDVLRVVRRQLSASRSLHRRALEQHRVWLALLERFFRRAAAPPR